MIPRPLEIDRDAAKELLALLMAAKPQTQQHVEIAADLTLQLAHYCRGGKLYSGTCKHCDERAQHENLLDQIRGGIRP